MTELRKQYISYMRYRNYSTCTIKSYCACLIQLSKHYNLSPDKITRNQFMDYLYYLVTDPRSYKQSQTPHFYLIDILLRVTFG